MNVMKEHQDDLGSPSSSPAPIRWAPVFLAAIAISVAILTLWPRPGSPRTDQGSRHPAVGTQISELDLQALTDNAANISPSDWKGKVVFLNFWGPWCGPCGVEFPHLVELEKKFRPSQDFRFLSVSCSGRPGDDLHMRDSTAAFLKQQQASFPVYRDANGAARAHVMQAAELGTVAHFAYPTTLVLGSDGKIRGLWQGYADGDEQAMLDVVQAALNEK